MGQVYGFALFFHLMAFATFAGAAATQGRLMQRSAKNGLNAAARDAMESMAAAVVTKVQLPAIFLSVISGIFLIMAKPSIMQNPGMHIKLTVVFILLVVSHLAMFNARKIVRARAGGGDQAGKDIEARKKRHGIFETIDVLGILTVLAIVAFRLRS